MLMNSRTMTLDGMTYDLILCENRLVVVDGREYVRVQRQESAGVITDDDGDVWVEISPGQYAMRSSALRRLSGHLRSLEFIKANYGLASAADGS